MFESSGKEIAWCVTVIRHAAIQAKKRHRRHKREVLVINRPIDSRSEWGDIIPARQDDEGFLESEIRMCLKELPSSECEVLSMLFFEDYTQEQVAEVLSVRQQQVSRIKNRGLRHLREKVLA